MSIREVYEARAKKKSTGSTNSNRQRGKRGEEFGGHREFRQSCSFTVGDSKLVMVREVVMMVVVDAVVANVAAVIASAYLLVLGSRRDNIVHQDGQQFSYSMHACSKCAILGSAAYGLSLGLGLVHPLAGY